MNVEDFNYSASRRGVPSPTSCTAGGAWACGRTILEPASPMDPNRRAYLLILEEQA